MDLGCTTEGGHRRGARRRGGGLQPRRRRDRGAGRAVRRLPGQPRRPRRAPGRRDPARRGLDRGAAASSSTPRGGRRWRTAPASRRARRGRTGRSCARSRRVLGRRCRSTRWRRCGRQMVAAAPHLAADRRGAGERVDAAGARAICRRRRLRGRRCGDHYLANPIMRASEVMAELARLARDAGTGRRWRRSSGDGVLLETASASSC